MEQIYINILKPILLFIVSIVVSIVAPIQDVLCVLGLGFLINIFTGIVTDVHVNGVDFNIRKAFNAISQLAFYSALVYYVHNSLNTLGFHDWGEKAAIWITFIVSYYYLANILRNATKIFPSNEAIKLMYMILTTKVFSQMRRYLQLGKESTKPKSRKNDKNTHKTS